MVTINVRKDGKAEIIKGKDSFLGKILESKGKVKINTPKHRGEFELTDEPEKKVESKGETKWSFPYLKD